MTTDEAKQTAYAESRRKHTAAFYQGDALVRVKPGKPMRWIKKEPADEANI